MGSAAHDLHFCITLTASRAFEAVGEWSEQPLIGRKSRSLHRCWSKYLGTYRRKYKFARFHTS